MRVLVDGLPLLGEASIGIYLRALLVHLNGVDGNHEYCLFFRGFRSNTRKKASKLMADPALGRFATNVTRLPDRILEWCWTRHSIHIPFTEIWLGRPDIFVSTAHMVPVLRGPAVVMIAYGLPAIRFPQFYGQDQPLLLHRLRRGIERSAAIIAISKFTKQEYVELLGADAERVHVIYPGIESRFGPEIDEDGRERVIAHYRLRPPYVLYVGVLAPHKNVGALVRVFRRLKHARHIPHQLVLCGRAVWGQAVVESAKDLILSGDCVVLDFIPASDLPHLYHGAQAFAFLSLHEGFGLPPLEAMACGVPVVSSNAGSLLEVVGDAGLLVPPTDEEAIEDALYRVLTNSALRDDLRVRGYRQASRFSWAETARQTLKVFEQARGLC